VSINLCIYKQSNNRSEEGEESEKLLKKVFHSLSSCLSSQESENEEIKAEKY
jgi:hypothetical protein